MALPFRIRDRSIQGNFDDLEKRFGAAGKWTPVTYMANWRALNDDSANYGASVTKDARGMVYARGLVERTTTSFAFGAAGTSAQLCVIPAGFRPKRTQYLMSWMIDINNARSAVRVIASPLGELYADGQLGPTPMSGAPGGYVAIEGLTWPTF